MENKNILGVIAEYNPFHNGHYYQIKKTFEKFDFKYSICLISSNFTQRGEAAIFNSNTRAEAAIKCMFDMVFETPLPFSCSSAEIYASYNVKLLSLLGVTHISFGYEGLNTQDEDYEHEILNKIAVTLAKEPSEYKNSLKQELKSGLSFPVARKNALYKYFNENEDYLNILNHPNNILAIEYLKALYKYDCNIKPVFIKRTGEAYNSCSMPTSQFASASSIRRAILKKDYAYVKEQVPSESYKIIINNKPLFNDDFMFLYNSAILNLNYNNFYNKNISQAESELIRRIYKSEHFYNSFDDIIQYIKSKQYTYTRVSRSLTHLLLGINEPEINITPFTILKAFRSKSGSYIKQVKKSNNLNIISIDKEASKILDSKAYACYKTHRYGYDLYRLAYFNKYKENLTDICKQKPIITD